MGEGKGHCHQMTQGGRKGFAIVSPDIFSKKIGPIFTCWPVFKGFRDITFGRKIK
jgi:hypothetical protein